MSLFILCVSKHLHGGEQGHCAQFADSQARGTRSDHLFASHSGRTAHFPPQLCWYTLLLACEAWPGCREEWSDHHSLYPVMSQPTLRPAACKIRAACRYLFHQTLCCCCHLPSALLSHCHGGSHFSFWEASGVALAPTCCWSLLPIEALSISVAQLSLEEGTALNYPCAGASCGLVLCGTAAPHAEDTQGLWGRMLCSHSS